MAVECAGIEPAGWLLKGTPAHQRTPHCGVSIARVTSTNGAISTPWISGPLLRLEPGKQGAFSSPHFEPNCRPDPELLLRKHLTSTGKT
jgi:hypothetical protein